MRLFTAIALAPETREALALLQDRIRRQLQEGSWIKKDQLHITLRFLGEIPHAQLPRVQSALGQVRGKPFSLSLHSLCTFGSRRQPRVLWAGFADDRPIVALQRTIAEHLDQAGIRSPVLKGKFGGHVTLCRFRQPSPSLAGRLDTILPQASPPSAEITVQAFDLYASTLAPDGPRYALLDRFALAEAF